MPGRKRTTADCHALPLPLLLPLRTRTLPGYRRRDSSIPVTPASPTGGDDPTTSPASGDGGGDGRRRSSSRASTSRRLSKAEYELEKDEAAEQKRRAKEVASPLRWALIHNNIEVVKYLVCIGAPVRLHQEFGVYCTEREHRCRVQVQCVCSLLFSHKASLGFTVKRNSNEIFNF